MTTETFTPNEIRDQAQLWFETHAGTYSRLLKRTKAEGKRAFVVFRSFTKFFPSNQRDFKFSKITISSFLIMKYV